MTEEERQAELRELWKQDRLRNWLSILFVVALLLGYPLLNMLVSALWVVFLLYSARRSASKGTRIINLVMLALPIGFFVFNLVLLIKG